MKMFDNMPLGQLARLAAELIRTKNRAPQIRENGKSIPGDKALYNIQSRILALTATQKCKTCGNAGPPSPAKVRRMMKQVKFTISKSKSDYGLFISFNGDRVL